MGAQRFVYYSPISHCPVSLAGFVEPLLSIDSPSVRPLSLPSDPPSGATSRIKKIARGESYGHATTISTLPDDVLLEIFAFCRKNHGYFVRTVWKWHVLVHVCQRWRQIVFASPHRLHLRLLCTYGTPVRKNLGFWPAFPIDINYHYFYSKSGITPNDEDNVVAALDHPDRVCDIRLAVTGSQLEKMATVMQGPFPVLTHLDIGSNDGKTSVLPAGFLGGSAPCLQVIYLRGIPFPALLTLLLSTIDLVTLDLRNIPPSGYISPEAMVVSLASLPRLETLVIEFQLANPRHDRIRLPPITRTVLPALTTFQFRGTSEYQAIWQLTAWRRGIARAYEIASPTEQSYPVLFDGHYEGCDGVNEVTISPDRTDHERDL